MEYCVLKRYLEKRKEQRLTLISTKAKAVIMFCLTMIIMSSGLMVLSSICKWNSIFYIISVGVLLVSLITMEIYRRTYEKKHLDRYIDLYTAKLKLLDDILKYDFDIHSKEKIDELILLYQTVLNEKEMKKKKKRKVIASICSGLLGFITMSTENVNSIGVNLWCVITIILFFFGVVSMVLLVLDEYFDDAKWNYGIMIRNLNEIKLLLK